jgi:hypothetical protein
MTSRSAKCFFPRDSPSLFLVEIGMTILLFHQLQQLNRALPKCFIGYHFLLPEDEKLNLSEKIGSAIGVAYSVAVWLEIIYELLIREFFLMPPSFLAFLGRGGLLAAAAGQLLVTLPIIDGISDAHAMNKLRHIWKGQDSNNRRYAAIELNGTSSFGGIFR